MIRTKSLSTHASRPHRLRRSLRRQRREEGMTLVEIMIVVIIMALIATAVGVAVLPQLQKAQDKTAKGDAQAIRSAVTLYIGENPGECPTVDDLKEGGFIDSSKRTTDPWDNEFQIECNGSNISVISAGKDGQFGTEDDIQ